MPQALPLTNKISDQSTKSYSYKTLSAGYGDGYSQRANDGINNKVETWTVKYVPLLQADRNTVMTVFDTVQGVDYVTWTPPGDSTSKKYVIVGVNESYNTIYFILTVSLMQIY